MVERETKETAPPKYQRRQRDSKLTQLLQKTTLVPGSIFNRRIQGVLCNPCFIWGTDCFYTFSSSQIKMATLYRGHFLNHALSPTFSTYLQRIFISIFQLNPLITFSWFAFGFLK